MKRSIEEFGFVDPLVWNKRTGHLVGGHQRLKVLKDLGFKEVEVSVVDLPPEKEELLAIALNKIQGDWDYEKLATLLEEFEELELDVSLTGFSEAEIAAILAEFSPRAEVPENVEELIESARRLRVPWDRFKVFHALDVSEAFFLPGFHYLVSFADVRKASFKFSRREGSLLFLDSGLLSGAKEEGPQFLKRQKELVALADAIDADWVAMMDIPMAPPILEALQMTPKQALETHLKLAREFKKLKTRARKVFVLQGRVLEDYECCAETFRKRRIVTDEDIVAVGSVKDLHSKPKFIAAVTALARDSFPENDLHLFGITGPKVLEQVLPVGITSCDSNSATYWLKMGKLVFAYIKEGEVFLEDRAFSEVLGTSLSCSGKLYLSALAWNMLQVELAIFFVLQQLVPDQPVVDQWLKELDTLPEEQ